jgi:hypothetical protein
LQNSISAIPQLPAFQFKGETLCPNWSMPQAAIRASRLPQVKPGVFFAPVAGEGVLLDLAANRYVGLTALSAQLWSVVSSGGAYDDLLRVAAHPAVPSKVSSERVVQQQLELWEKFGLLVRDREEVVPDLPRPRLELPRATGLILPAEAARARFSLRRVVQQAWNSIWVRRSLRRIGLSATIRAIQQIPSPNSANSASSRLKVILRAYWLVRKPFAQGNPDCLSRSLALFRTLRQAGIDASICIGVRKCPFAAHAWVESANLLLNDRLENVDQYFVIARF